MLRSLLVMAGLAMVVLSGCFQPDDPMGPQVRNPGMDFQDSDPPGNYILERSAVVPGMPGILLHAEMLNDGQFHAMRVNATNVGGPTYQVLAGNCEPTWRDVMSTNGTPFSHRHRIAWLQCCAWKDFGPGDSLLDSFEWNELVWDDRNHRSTAPPGDYTWTALIPLWKADEEPCIDEPTMGQVDIELTTSP